MYSSVIFADSCLQSTESRPLSKNNTNPSRATLVVTPQHEHEPKITSDNLIDLLSSLFLLLTIKDVAIYLDLESDGEIDVAHKIAFRFESPVHRGRIKPTQHPL